MNRRFTTWLMALLMLVTASIAVPAVRTAESPGTAGIVWLLSAADAEAAESCDSGQPVTLPAIAHTAAAVASFRPSAPLDTALFQRPPPATIHS